VGDLEQSIFSFQGADATACQKLAAHHGLKVLRLNENHRCSQRICDIAARFCSHGIPDTAVGPNAGCEIPPEIALYPPEAPPAAIEIYRARLTHHGIAPENAAVLVRRWSVADALMGERRDIQIEDRPQRLGRIAQALASGTLTRHQVVQVQQILSFATWNTTNLDELDDSQHERLRAATYAFLRTLPPLDGDLRNWIKSAARTLDASACTLDATPMHGGGMTLRSSAAHSRIAAAAAFSPPPRELSPQTVHDIKGEDREAVMMVVHRPHGADPTRQLALWEATLAGTPIDEDQQEERRITFVALTRAQKYCLVAVPDDARGRAVVDACLDLGFVRTG
jgi:hypothetical protein